MFYKELATIPVVSNLVDNADELFCDTQHLRQRSRMQNESRYVLEERDDGQRSAEEVILDVHLSVICIFRLMRRHSRRDGTRVRV